MLVEMLQSSSGFDARSEGGRGHKLCHQFKDGLGFFSGRTLGGSWMPGANDGMSVSATMIAQLRQSEGGRGDGGYYTDPVGNCTAGVGVLVHHGGCTAAELAAHPDAAANEAALMSQIHIAEQSVRASVGDRVLSQAQFDSLVSAVFNLGGNGVRSVLHSANQADDPGVVRGLNGLIHGRRRGPDGRPIGPYVVLPGLIRRRAREALPFQPPAGAAR